MSDPAKTIAFIGIGVMGYPMAVNLRSKISSDYTVLVCDVSTAAIDKFKTQMAGKGPVGVITSGAEAIKAADTVITMLPDGKVVKSVYLDPTNGILAGARALSPAPAASQKLVMECGTIETDVILSVAKAVTDSGLATFVDAPVSGGPMGAEAGTLTFMVGGAESVFPRVKSILQHMGKPDNVFHCGDVGAGTAFKVINNYLSAITSVAASEALNIGVKMGLDVKKLSDVINVSGGQCWVTSQSNPVPGVMPNVPASRGYEGGFRIELCKKVFKMGVELARMVGARTVLDKVTMDAFEEAAGDPRYAGKDARVVFKWLNEST